MVNVIKANGEIEPFSEEKLRASIKRAGISQIAEDRVVEQVKNSLYDKIPTSLIYSNIRQYFGETQKGFGTKYSLKQSIMELGPTGFPFEDLISEILKKEGYQTEVRQTLLGKCIKHEVDVIAAKENEKIMVEAKFHNLPGNRTDVHVAMYTKARFDDLKEKNGLTKAFLVTNTKLTTDAITYANCEGISVVSWNYPETNNLRDYIEKWKIYPITQLDSITPNYKKALLDNHIILCSSISNECMSKVGIPQDAQKDILGEVKDISNHHNLV